MRNFQGIIFVWIWIYGETFNSALVCVPLTSKFFGRMVQTFSESKESVSLSSKTLDDYFGNLDIDVTYERTFKK